MIRSRKSSALVLAALLPALAAAFPVRAGSDPAQAPAYLPPVELIAGAVARRPEVRAAAARADAARAQARALSAGNHELAASVGQHRRRVDGEGDYDEWDAELSRAIRLPGKAALDREIGQHTRAAAELQHREISHEAAVHLLRRWMEWLRAAAAEDEARTRHASLGQQHAALSRRTALGDASRLDLDLLEAELAQANAAAVQSEAALAVAALALTSDFPDIPLPAQVPALPEPVALPGAAEDWVARMVAHSHGLKAAREGALRQQAAASRARVDRWADPTIGIRMLNERDGAERSLGLVLSVPIGGRYRAALADAAYADADALHQEAEALQRDIEREARLALAEAAGALSRWRAYATATDAAASAARRMHRAWELGEADLAERLLAERRARETAQEGRRARVDALEAGAYVQIESGAMWGEAVPHDDEH